MDYNCGLKKWCASHKFFSMKPYSHTFLDGGVIGMDADQIPGFLKCYAWNIKNNNDVSVSEMRTDIFRFFIDIDFELSFELSKEQIINLVEGIQGVIREVILPIDNLYCILSHSPPKIIDDVKIKNGVHIVWPRMYVDQLGARKLRDLIVQKLIIENDTLDWDTAINDTHDWEAVIDESVYVNSGLRMMYSKKAEKCKECKECKTKMCNNCCNTGFKYSRPYTPLSVIGIDGVEDVVRKKIICKPNQNISQMMQVLSKTSIRSTRTSPNLKFNEPYPSWYKPSKFIKGKVSRKKNNPNYLEDPTLIEETKMNCGNGERIDRTDIRYIQTQDFIRDMWAPYPALNITTFIKKKRRNHYYYYLRTDQHYCHNVSRDHSSNHIWLTIDPDTRSVMQRCFATNCTGYMTTLESLKMNDKLYDLLYPDLSEKIIANKRKIIPIVSITGTGSTIKKNKNKSIADILQMDNLF
jgi:hypothetical protein